MKNYENQTIALLGVLLPALGYLATVLPIQGLSEIGFIFWIGATIPSNVLTVLAFILSKPNRRAFHRFALGAGLSVAILPLTLIARFTIFYCDDDYGSTCGQDFGYYFSSFAFSTSQFLYPIFAILTIAQLFIGKKKDINSNSEA